MLNTKTILAAALAVTVATSCSKQATNTVEQPEAAKPTVTVAPGTLSGEQYSKTMESFKKKIHKMRVPLVNGRVPDEMLDPTTDPGPGTPTYIGYTTGGYVGDPYDDVTAADGPTVQAISVQEEEQTRVMMQDQIGNAKAYLNFHGLDMSDEFSYDDPRYVHAANIVMEMENTRGIPGQGGGYSPFATARENTLLGCAMQAIGINTLYEAWFDKFATKRMLIAAVGKVATRYLGWVGAAIAVYDFIDCMWG